MVIRSSNWAPAFAGVTGSGGFAAIILLHFSMLNFPSFVTLTIGTCCAS